MFQTELVEKIKTHILCPVTFFPLQNRTVYKIMWKDNLEWGRPHITIWRMRIACGIPKATNIHSEYVIIHIVPGNNAQKPCPPHQQDIVQYVVKISVMRS
jgi:hypothetical protein